MGTWRLVQVSLFCALTLSVTAADTPRHVVLVVWDGMRPDFVTEKYAPTLNKLARDGVRFRNHHSVYITATNVNGAALATGAYPNRNGIVANLEFRPAINPRQAVDTADPDVIKRGDEVSGGKYLALPTIAELIRAAGKQVALVGTKSAAVLFDRKNDWTVVPLKNGPLTIFAAAPVPEATRDEVVNHLGPFLNEPSATAAQRNTYATRALTELLWRDGVPDFSPLWLSEPDLAQHNFAPGSREAIAAIKSTDDNLATVLSALEKKQARDSTDIFVVSDHGFSTIRRSIDVVTLLNKAGFRAGKSFSDDPRSGDILVAGNAGSVLFYVHQRERALIARLVDWLQRTDFAGVIFAREKMVGTSRMDEAHMDSRNPADVVISFRWYEEKNSFGVAGLIDADWNRKAGEGTHATLSKYDVANVLVAAGPDFRHGFEDEQPTSNLDIAPTILRLLGVSGTDCQGRALEEAVAESAEGY
jgi:arylsulfatase A-like enzyme